MLKGLSKDIAVYGGADLAFKLASFIVVPIYTHLLDLAEFGLMSLLVVSATLIGFLVNLGVNNALHRFYFDPDVAKEERRDIVSAGLVQLLASACLVIGVALLLVTAGKDTLLDEYGIHWIWAVIVLVNILPEQVSQYTLDTVRLYFTPWRFVGISLVKNMLGVVLGLWLVVRWDMGLTGIFLGTLIASTAAVPVGLWVVRKDLTLRINVERVKAIFRFGYPFVFTSAAYWIFGSMDRWLLIELSTAEEVGLFSVAFKFAALMSLVTGAFGQAWSPYAMRMMRENPDYRNFYSMVLSSWLFLLAVIALGLALFARELLELLTPPQYWAAAPMLSIVAAGLVLAGTTQVTALGISLAKKTSLLTVCAWLAAFSNVGLNLLLIPYLGGAGSAVATLISYGVLTGGYLYFTQRVHPLPLERGKLAYGLMLVMAAATIPLLFTNAVIGPVTILLKIGLIGLAVGGGFAVGLIPTHAPRLALSQARIWLGQAK